MAKGLATLPEGFLNGVQLDLEEVWLHHGNITTMCIYIYIYMYYTDCMFIWYMYMYL